MGMEEESREGDLGHANAFHYSRQGAAVRTLYCTSPLDRRFPWWSHISSSRGHGAHIEAEEELRGGDEKGEELDRIV
jgi:hypothetical protein